MNRKARHEYEIIDKYEAGISLLGSEVKSLRAGNVSLGDAHVVITDNRPLLRQLHIQPWPWATIENHEPTRPRPLLLNKAEIISIKRAIQQKGMTVVVLRIYLKGPRFKVEIATGRGKKLHDKRKTLKERDAKRDLERARR